MGSENWFLVWDIGKESVIIGLVWLVLEEPHVLQRILVIDWKGLDIDGNLGLYFGSISFFFSPRSFPGHLDLVRRSAASHDRNIW